MARDYYDESKKKKKVVKKSQPSSSIKNSIKQAQERGAKRTASTNVQAQQSYQNTRTSSVSGRSAASSRHVQDQRTPSQAYRDRVNQKSYGTTQPTRRATSPTSSNANRTRNTPATAAEMRRQQGQNQKSTAGVTREQQEKTKQRFSTAKEMMNARAEEGRKQKMGENSVATKEQKETVERAIRNTPSVVKKAALDAGSGYMQTLTEIADMTASSETGARAKAMKLGYEYNDTEGLAKVKEERRRTVKAAREDNKKLHEAQKKRQEEFDKKTKGAKGLEKAYYGALESGTGMLADIGIGAITGTGQAGSLASMYMRTFGSSTNQARDEGATDKEARRFGFWQANKEVGTELMFPGTGLVKKAYGKAGLPLAERAANRLIKGLSGRAADVTHTGLRLGLGTGEEVTEEGAGWLLDPVIKEFTYGKNVRKREAQEVMNRISEDMRSKIKDENDAASASAYLSSDTFLEDTKKDYMEEGLSEKEAEVVANKMRDFLTASLIGDTETMERLEDEISKDVAKAHNILDDYSGKELLETIASTSLLTGVTGLPGTMTSAAKGAALRDELGEKGVRALAKTAIDFEDETDSYKGQAARDRLDSGKELTSTQVYELAEATQKQIEKDSRRQEASVDSASKRIKAENLIAPYGVNANGEMVIDDVINEKFETNAKTAETTIKNFDANREEGQKSLTDTAVRNGSRAIARWKAGVFTVEDANELNYSNTAVRSAFEEETGVDLGQYVVKDKNGKVDISKTNAATKDALFAMASDNLVESAREATVNWMDNVKGEVQKSMSERLHQTMSKQEISGGKGRGDVAAANAINTVDPRDRSKFMFMATAVPIVYSDARYKNSEWDDVKDEYKEIYKGLDQSALKGVFEAAKEDKQIAENKNYGKPVKAGDPMSKNSLKDTEPVRVPGKVIDLRTDADSNKLSNNMFFYKTAVTFGSNITLVSDLYLKDTNGRVVYSNTETGEQINEDELAALDNKEQELYVPVQVEGAQDSNGIILNTNEGIERNIEDIAKHETIHEIRMNAPEEFKELARYLQDKLYSADPEAFMQIIQEKQRQYRSRDLTMEEAMEELIAEGGVNIDWDQLIADIETNPEIQSKPTFIEAIKNAFKIVIQKLRSILSSDVEITDEAREATLDQLLKLEDGYKLLVRAARAAKVDQANQAINDWQDEVNAQSGATERLSISAQQDANYMKAVESGDMETAQRMVDEAAKASGGYTENGNIVHLFHGTNAFGFTEFDLSKTDDGISIFLTSDKKTATTYSGTDNQRSISEKSDVKLDTYEEIEEALNKYDPNKSYSESEYKYYDSEAIEQFVQDTNNELSVFIEEMNDLLNNHSDIMSKEDIERFETMREQAKSDDPLLITNLWFSSPEYAGKHAEDYQRYYDAINMITDPLELEKHLRLREKLNEDWHPEGLFIESQLNGYSYEVISPETAKGMAEQFAGSGIYDLYTTFSNPLVIDNKENDNWNSIRVPKELQQDMWDFFGHQFSATRTRNYAQYAKAKGYDGVIFKGIRDNGGRNYGTNEVSGDVFIVFNPNEVKSADPVTYDDNGDVITLSQRFDMENQDIRYSLGTESDIMNTLEDSFNEYKEDKQNLRIATKALDDLQRSRHSLDSNDASGRWDGGIQVRTTGKGITTSLINEGRLDFRGQTVKSPEDLAKLCQVLRDPRFETFRVVLTKGDKIVSFRSISSRLPGLSRAFETDDLKDSIEIVRDRMNRLGADGYYLIHNHPSGNVNASFEDLSVTRAYLALLGQDTYKGHIILDHDEYGFIDAAIPQQIHGENFPTPRIEPITGQQTIDFLHEPEIDHPVLGSKIKNSQDVANIAQTINTSDGVSVLLYTSSQSKVRGIQEISNKALKNNKEISGYIRNQAIEEFGTPAAFLYTTDLDTYNRGKELIGEGVLMDAVIGYGFKTQDGGLIESGRANVSEVGEIGHLGLDEEGFNKRTKVFESASGLQEYDAIRYSITPKMDADYMDAVNNGNMEEAQKLVDEAAKAAMPNTKTPGLWLHGTENEFTVFDFSQGGKNGTAEGFGIYLARDRDVSEHYGKLMIEGYVNIEKPASSSAKTINKSTLKKLIKATVEQEANKLAEDYDNDVEAAKRDTWISNYAYTYDKSLDASISEVADSILEMNFSDMEIVQEVMAGMAIRDYDAAVEFYDLLTDITGFDGFTTTWENQALEGTRDIALAFRSNQIKSAETVTYADDGSIIPLSERFNPENDDIRYSLPTQSSQGNILSDGQMEYFKNSQARDEQGRLLRLYHGTQNGGFTIFDPSYGISSRAFFFTNSLASAKGYSGTDAEFTPDMAGEEDIRVNYPVYLDMQNPLIVDAEGHAWVDIPFDGDYVSSNWLVEYAQSEGYDSVIIKNVIDRGSADTELTSQDDYIVFNSNQVKDVNNLNPTENPDIRYSIAPEDEVKSKMAYEYAMDDSYEALEYYEQRLADLTEEAAENRPIKKFSEEKISEFYSGLRSAESWVHTDPVEEEDAVRMAKSKDDFFANLNAKWNDRWRTDGEVLDVKSVKADVRNLVMGVMQNSDTDSQYKNDLVKKTLFDIRTAFQLMKQDRPEVASELLYYSAQRMIDNVQFYVDGTFDQYKELKHYLRNTRISIGEEYWADVEYDTFRKRNFGRIKLVKGRTNVDQVYQELEELFPEFFDSEETMDVPSQLLQMEYVLDSVQPYKEAYSSEEAAELAFDIADDLYEIMVNGDEVRSLADTYKARYDAKTKAMKQRHAEAMLRVRRAKEEGIQKERQKFREYKERQKEQKLHRKEFDSIQKSYNTLKDRLLSNTADSNIPEQYKKELAGLLAAFDLQTVKSKQLEKKRMIRSKKSIKMSAIRTALRQIEVRTQQFFHVNDAITDIIDELLGVNAEYPAAASIEGKTIDELSVDELIRIDKLLKALVHEFNTYKNVRIQDRNEKAQDIADAQVTSALDHAKKFGPGTDWHGIRGGIDKVLNMDEVTPAYMFRMIDRENKGLGMMWKELERSQDKYIRNTEQLSKWMSEITGKYHNKGRFGNKYGADEIAEWRRSRSVRDFNLTNGSISLTPAQMMSLAMLANRPQAYQHMIGAGVVVAPVNFQAKMETDLKRKTNRALPLILTDADIKLIVSQLTPEQRRVAEDLQQLMANQMAEWGNEASMDVLGIRLFEEKEYFPIKSDRAALEKDLTADQFEQAIRNFGFTKAVMPGARNAIMIDDIFDVVTEHCNNMNLYNSYSKALNDFMKVYNKHTFQEDGSDYSVAQALGHAYSQKTTTFIMNFVKDLNGNVSRGRDTGIESMLQTQLANAKKASVFANIRVLLQQPTAITRAFAVINPKYLKGVKIEKGAMEEMFEHCPIAKWKSWGYYDINMGKQIEDIIMNEGNFLNDLATQAYGAADNVTWTAIWQMVKAEMKDTHPDVVEGSDEFWYQCNERMREIVDLTQVVDSPLHRSHAMRDKNFFVKMATSFMAEPTLTFNMVRDGYIRAKEAWDLGNKKEAASIMNKTMSVYVLQAATVAAAAAIADAIRGKSPDGGGDDEDKDFFSNWWANTIANFKDEIALWNKVYYIKDIASIFEGYEAWNLGTQGITNMVKGYNQLTKKLSEGSKTSWWNIYQNLFGGIGYMLGIPVKTLMKDGKAVFEMLGGKLPEKLVGEEKSDAVVDKDSAFGRLIAPKDKSEGKSASAVKVSEEEHWYDYGNNPLSVKDGSALDNFLNHFGINLTGTEKAAAIQAQKDKEIAEKTEDISKSVADLDGEEKAKKTWSKVTTEMKDVEGRSVKELIAEGEFSTIDKYREMYIAAGNDADYFDSRIMAETKKALKKSIAFEQTAEEMYAQQEQKAYLKMNGMTDAEISEIAYKSDLARDAKVAMILGDEELIQEALLPLAQAGLTQDDLNKMWENRNRIDLKKYNGRYKDKLKSTGNYVFPCDGVITSDFGHRSSPGGIGSTNHQGIDIGAAQGTPVAAADGGVVVMAGWYGGYGKTVQIRHDDGTITQYSHLSWWDVKEGDVVGQGQEVGLVGSTGNSTGPHLHLGVIKNDRYVDPKKYFNTYDKKWDV